MTDRRLVYCHCAYAKVVPQDAKAAALQTLAGCGRAFEAVPDLCEMSARKDPALARLAEPDGDGRPVDIVACYPRAVRWLFHAAGQELDPETRIVNMRGEDPAGELETVLSGDAPLPVPSAETEPADEDLERVKSADEVTER